MILVSRVVSMLLLALLGYQLGQNAGLTEQLPNVIEVSLNFGLLMVLGAVGGWFIGGLLGKLLQRALERANARFAARSGAELVVGALGLIVGLAASALLSLPVMRLEPIGNYLLLPMTLIVAYISVEAASAKHREILRLFGVRSDGDGARAKLLDTSALIDGRIADIVDTGFLEGELIVPVFVLEELQSIADSSDEARRARGKRGLEVVTTLRKARRLTTIDENPTDIPAVDSKLTQLSRRHNWVLITNDVNLARVAQAQQVTVLNINELANALKAEYVPGEQITLKLVRSGKEDGQGVGYLDDGTMVVVDGGAEYLGQSTDVEVTSMLQSPTGKIVFARVKSGVRAAPKKL